MKVYAIKDLNQYASQMRELTANNISENYTENLDDFITIPQLNSLIRENSDGLDEDGRILINEETNEELFGIISDWIYGAGLSKLASQDLVQCAWDSEQNCMVFWTKESRDVV